MSRASTWARAAGICIASCWTVASLAQASDLKAWRLLADSAPFPPTLAVPMGVYDPLRHRVLAIDMDNRALTHVVHVFAPGPEPNWSTLATSGTPPGRQHLASLVHDPVRDRLLVFGGYYEQGVTVWAVTLSGTPSWQRLVTNGTLPPKPCGAFDGL